MGEGKEDDEWISVPIPRKVAAIVLIAIITSIFGGVGGGFVSLVPSARPDACTGTTCGQIAARITKLEDQFKDLKDDINLYRLRQEFKK